MSISRGTAGDDPVSVRPARALRKLLAGGRNRDEAAGVAAPEVAFGPIAAVALSVWYGLFVGLAELALVLIQKRIHDPSPLFFRINRNVVWTIPTVNLALFGLVGLLLALVIRAFPRRAAWPRVAAGLTGGLAMLALLLSFNKLYSSACVILACGFAYRSSMRGAARLSASRRVVRWSLPVLAACVLGLVWLSIGRDVLRERRAMASLPAAPAHAPNVLMVVLDTVRADRMSLYGYGRDTTPHLSRLSRRGIRFDQARSTAPWTLPSHASMMTGRWPHQNSARLHGPLDGSHATLAEFLAAKGYATAGFVANITYTGAETGLARGFAHYEDHDLSPQAILCTSALGRRLIWRCVVAVSDYVSDYLGGTLKSDFRKDAGRISGDLLAWTEGQGERPFFAFLNFIDAHSPYIPPASFGRHFGIKPESDDDVATLDQWFTLDKAKLAPRDIQLASDAYDDCIAYLDDRLGRLFDELDRRGVLANTLVLVTADHGEHFGEHSIYCHASSLYDQEIHVPLLAILPGNAHAGRSVAAPVSLRDLPATVVDVLGLGDNSPFPGRSLACQWDDDPSSPRDAAPLLSEVDGPAKSAPNLGSSPAFRGPMQAVVAGQEVYIRNGDGVEELYDLASDPSQAHDLAHAPASLPRLATLRSELDRMTSDDTRPAEWRSTVDARRQGGKTIGPARRAR